MPQFSVILATRNRPQLFARALAGVLAQSYAKMEILVVNDGSRAEALAEYHEALDAHSSRVRLFSLIERPMGHGQSYALNFGAAQAAGDYLCFLDDDDEWCDSTYLERVARIIRSDAEPVALHLADQAAFDIDGKRQPGPIWIEDLAARLMENERRPEPHGAYRVSIDDLLQCYGFAHLNTMIVRRALFEGIGGLDESLRYENDRDFYLRLIDRAQAIRYTPGVISHHYIPDQRKSENMSTMLAGLTKRNLQVRLLSKANCFATHPQIRVHARVHTVFALKKLAEQLAAEGRYREAAFYARMALGGRPSLKWASYALLLSMRALGQR